MDLSAYTQQIADHFPELYEKLEDVTLILSGWDSVVMDVAAEIIFRFPRREEVRAGLEREIRLLRSLQGKLPLPVPDHRFVARDDAGKVLFSGYRKLAGKGLQAGELESRGIAEAIGDFLTSLHKFPVGEALKAGIPAFSPEEWRGAYLDFYEWVRANAFPRIAEAEREDCAAVWERYLENGVNFTFQPALIHGDLGAEHILYDDRVQAVTGVIDWEDARIGDAALDFTGIYALTREQGLQRVLDAYHRPMEDSLFERIRFYANAIPFHSIRFGLQSGERAYVQSGLEQIKDQQERIKQYVSQR